MLSSSMNEGKAIVSGKVPNRILRRKKQTAFRMYCPQRLGNEVAEMCSQGASDTPFEERSRLRGVEDTESAVR